jgi:Tol biopolymer transport system component
VRWPRPAAAAASLALALLLAPGPATAQPYDPDYRWRTVDTPHFQVHFHQGLEALAQRAAREAERAHARLAPLLGYSPKERTQLVLSDDTDAANGSATPLPYNTIRVYVVPAESGSVLNDERDGLEAVITHEYVHILHLDNIGGFPALVNTLFGKIWPPNGLTPAWLIEGLAVAHEAPTGGGAGRNESAVFDMYLRSLVLEPPGLPTLAQASNPYLEWPRGTLVYLVGGRFVAWLEQRSGIDRMRAFLADQGSQIFPWAPSWASERWFGADLPTLWDQFAAEQARRGEAQLAEVRQRPVTHPAPLTRRGGMIERPRWLPDGSGLVYLDRGLDERPGLRRVSRGGEDLGRALAVDQDGTFALRSASEAVVAKGQVWHEYRRYVDLYLADLDRGCARRLTDGERATDPALTPDGGAVVYVAQAGGGEQALRRRRLDGGPAETLLQLPGASLYEPAVSPDGRRIALSVQRHGRRDLALLEDGELRELTSDDALDRAPSWSPDGRWLLFTSDRGGVDNIYAWESATGAIRQVTNVETGALEPAVSPDGATLAFVSYSRRGHDLATIPFDPATWLDPAPAAPALPPPEPAPGEELPTRPYQVSETVTPTLWLPTWSTDGAGQTYGFLTTGVDALWRHVWQFDTWVSPKASTAGYAFSYTGGWSWPSLDFYSARWVAGSPGYPDRLVSAWTPFAPGATFTFTRLERALAFRLGWTPTRIDSLAPVPPSTGYPPGQLFADGLLAEAALSVAYDDTHRYPRSISSEEGRHLALRLRYADRSTGSDYDLWRARASWSEFTRVPFTRHVVLATRLSGAVSHGSLGGSPPFSLGGIPPATLLSLTPLQAFSASDQLRGYPAGLFAGNGTVSASVELRFPIFAPEFGYSTWPVFLRRVHGAVFADLGEAFVQGTERGYSGPDFHWARLRAGAGAELRLETALAYWLLTDVRVGVARGLGKPFGGVSPTKDPWAVWQWYVVMGPSF